MEEEPVLISDTESVVVGPPRHTEDCSGSNGHCLYGGSGAGSLATVGPAV